MTRPLSGASAQAEDALTTLTERRHRSGWTTMAYRMSAVRTERAPGRQTCGRTSSTQRRPLQAAGKAAPRDALSLFATPVAFGACAVAVYRLAP